MHSAWTCACWAQRVKAWQWLLAHAEGGAMQCYPSIRGLRRCARRKRSVAASHWRSPIAPRA